MCGQCKGVRQCVCGRGGEVCKGSVGCVWQCGMVCGVVCVVKVCMCVQLCVYKIQCSVRKGLLSVVTRVYTAMKRVFQGSVRRPCVGTSSYRIRNVTATQVEAGVNQEAGRQRFREMRAPAA